MFKRKLERKIVELENRIQDMSEIITDFETNEFKIAIDEYCSLITNNAKGTSAIEINVHEVKNFMNGKEFEGKELSFTLKHPRTYR